MVLICCQGEGMMRRSALADLGGEAAQQTELVEEGAVALDAEIERHLRRTDIG